MGDVQGVRRSSNAALVNWGPPLERTQLGRPNTQNRASRRRLLVCSLGDGLVKHLWVRVEKLGLDRGAVGALDECHDGLPEHLDVGLSSSADVDLSKPRSPLQGGLVRLLVGVRQELLREENVLVSVKALGWCVDCHGERVWHSSAVVPLEVLDLVLILHQCIQVPDPGNHPGCGPFQILGITKFAVRQEERY